jgi:hypothetical protein
VHRLRQPLDPGLALGQFAGEGGVHALGGARDEVREAVLRAR